MILAQCGQGRSRPDIRLSIPTSQAQRGHLKALTTLAPRRCAVFVIMEKANTGHQPLATAPLHDPEFSKTFIVLALTAHLLFGFPATMRSLLATLSGAFPLTLLIYGAAAEIRRRITRNHPRSGFKHESWVLNV